MHHILTEIWEEDNIGTRKTWQWGLSVKIKKGRAISSWLPSQSSINWCYFSTSSHKFWLKSLSQVPRGVGSLCGITGAHRKVKPIRTWKQTNVRSWETKGGELFTFLFVFFLLLNHPPLWVFIWSYLDFEIILFPPSHCCWHYRHSPACLAKRIHLDKTVVNTSV